MGKEGSELVVELNNVFQSYGNYEKLKI